MTPQVSIIIPVYNVAAYVGPCLASLQAQTHSDFEAIVIDDGSTDGSNAAIMQAVGNDPRFSVITQKNRGLSAARNAGLDVARGDIIGFLDGDDRFDPAFLSRMLAALEDSAADWVACGLRNMHADGTEDTHSARYDAPDALDDALQIYPLDSWEQAIAHYPSAWNKLYRRALIDGLRFDEGTWFEDHAYYLQLAARTDRIAHLARPLYWQTRGRTGQITTTDSDRVFEQLSVLDRLAPILTGPAKSGGRAALGALAHRLIHERGTVLRDQDRRVRFVTAARDWLRDHKLSAAPGPDFSPLWAAELETGPPLSVILPWDGQDRPLEDTMRALSEQSWPGFETLIVADTQALAARATQHLARAGRVGQALTSTGSGAGAARNTGLDAAQGQLVVFLDAGDRLAPDTLARWTEAMLRQEADLGQSQFNVGLGGAAHCGLHDASLLVEAVSGSDKGLLTLTPDLALALHCYPSARILRREFLVDHGLRFGPAALGDWQIGIGAALLTKRALYFDWPGIESSEDSACRRIWRAPATPGNLIQALDAAWASWPEAARASLPPDWQRRLLARALWEKWHFSPMSPRQKRWFRIKALWVIRRRGLHRMEGPLDCYLSDDIREMLGA